MTLRSSPGDHRLRASVAIRLAAGIGFALVGASGFAQSTAALPTNPAAPFEKAQNVIVLIGSGLGPATTTAARLMRYREDGSLASDTMPNLARVRTWALDAQTANSAAAASALLTGVKVRNDVVAMDSSTRAAGFAPGRDPIRSVAGAENHCPASDNGKPSRNLIELAIAKNRATGIVTTGRMTAGPAAAAYAHVCHRDAEYEVARPAASRPTGPRSAAASTERSARVST